jgi:hypothetical protein
MSKLSNSVFSLALILSVLLSGCMAFEVNYAIPQAAPVVEAGEVISLYPGTTIQGIANALKGLPGTQIWAKNGQFVFAWVMQGQGWGVVGAIPSGNAQLGVIPKGMAGNLINAESYSNQLVTCLKEHGWVKVAPAAVPLAFRTAVLQVVASAAEKAAFMSTSLANFLIIPVIPGMLTPPGFEEIQS